MAATDAGSLLASIVATFNGATMIFATIMLIFIGILGMVKTAQDGEFLGRSWNTTFTALRLMAGIGFLLPMPNHYSVIQNFVMYVGLWGSGVANQVTNVTAEHYLRRLQVNMTAGVDPSAATVRNEAPGLLAMHACASFTNAQYGQRGARLVPQWTNLGAASRVEFAWVEAGSYLVRQSAPCGRLVIDTLAPVVVDARSGVPAGTWDSNFFSDPFNAEARKVIAATADEAAKVARLAKVDALRELTATNGPLVGLGDTIAMQYAQSLPVYNADGSLARGPAITQPFSVEFTQMMLDRYAGAVRQANRRLTERMDVMRSTILEKAKGEGDGSFFATARTMLEDGGWMGSAAVYRTMLDLVSVRFVGDQQLPARVEGAELLMAGSGALMESGSGGLGTHVASLQKTLDRIFSSDTASTVLSGSLGAAESGHGALPAVNKAALERVANNPSPNSAFEVLYGANFIESFRNKLFQKMALSDNFDPLFQVKSIGDMATGLAEYLTLGKVAWNASVAAVDIAGSAATGNVVGQATGANSTVQALIRGAERVMSAPLQLAGWLAGALAGIGYLFSTWLPALPVVAMLLAQLSWVLAFLMTMFAVNIWAVMHLTPAQNDTFIGSQSQGYLLISGLFFRPIIATSALAISFLIAPPVVSLLNTTLLPAMFASNVSTNTVTIMAATLFGLILYFVLVKAALTMVFLLPQSFPDEVLRFIGAGVGDLGQARGLAAVEPASQTGHPNQVALANLNSLAGNLHSRKAVPAGADKAAATPLPDHLSGPKHLGLT